MTDEKIITWIKTQLSSGNSPEAVRLSLSQNGYDPNILDEVLNNNSSNNAVVNPVGVGGESYHQESEPISKNPFKLAFDIMRKPSTLASIKDLEVNTTVKYFLYLYLPYIVVLTIYNFSTIGLFGLLTVIDTPIGLLIGVSFLSAIMHLFAKILGAKNTFKNTIASVVYGYTPVILFSSLDFIIKLFDVKIGLVISIFPMIFTGILLAKAFASFQQMSKTAAYVIGISFILLYLIIAGFGVVALSMNNAEKDKLEGFCHEDMRVSSVKIYPSEFVITADTIKLELRSETMYNVTITDVVFEGKDIEITPLDIKSFSKGTLIGAIPEKLGGKAGDCYTKKWFKITYSVSDGTTKTTSGTVSGEYLE